MRLVFTSYVKSPTFTQPIAWLKRIEACTGILQSLSHNHIVTGIERIDFEGNYEQEGVQYCFIRLKRNVVYFPFRIHSLIETLEPDVVFVNGFIFPLQVIQLKWRIGRKKKIIVLHRAEKPFRGIKRWLQLLADKSVDAYLFSSLDFRDVWKRNLDVRKIHQVMQASSVFLLEHKGLARTKTNVEGQPIFLWVGRLDKNKDPLTVVRAFLQFSRRQPTATLYMIYQDEDLLPSIKKMIESDSKAAGTVHLVGKIDHAHMQSWYNSADFFIAGSHYEGGGTAVTEAMSCGCIPILTDIPSFRGITGHGKCGLLYRPGSEKELVQVLEKAVSLSREQELQKVLRQFNDELSFDAIAGKINKIINSLR